MSNSHAGKMNGVGSTGSITKNKKIIGNDVTTYDSLDFSGE